MFSGFADFLVALEGQLLLWLITSPGWPGMTDDAKGTDWLPVASLLPEVRNQVSLGRRQGDREDSFVFCFYEEHVNFSLRQGISSYEAIGLWNDYKLQKPTQASPYKNVHLFERILKYFMESQDSEAFPRTRTRYWKVIRAKVWRIDTP